MVKPVTILAVAATLGLSGTSLGAPVEEGGSTAPATAPQTTTQTAQAMAAPQAFRRRCWGRPRRCWIIRR